MLSAVLGVRAASRQDVCNVAMWVNAALPPSPNVRALRKTAHRTTALTRKLGRLGVILDSLLSCAKCAIKVAARLYSEPGQRMCDDGAETTLLHKKNAAPKRAFRSKAASIAHRRPTAYTFHAHTKQRHRLLRGDELKTNRCVLDDGTTRDLIKVGPVSKRASS